MARMAKDRYSVLLVDDSEDDRLFLRKAILRNPKLAIAGEVCDGEAALAYLEGQDAYKDREKHPFPDVMLLDLKMPRMTGHEVLEWLQTRGFGKLIVIVISGSFLPQDINRSMALGANAYFKKSAARDEQEAMVREIALLLDKSVDLPPARDGGAN